MLQPVKKVLVGAAAIAALALGGSALANATTSTSATTTTTSSSGASGTPPAAPKFDGPAHGTAAHENAEKPVTGATADKVRAAAVKSVGSGTAGDVTTDMSGRGFETTVTKSDGTKVEVHLNSSYRAIQGHRGSPGGRGCPGGPGGRGRTGGWGGDGGPSSANGPPAPGYGASQSE